MTDGECRIEVHLYRYSSRLYPYLFEYGLMAAIGITLPAPSSLVTGL